MCTLSVSIHCLYCCSHLLNRDVRLYLINNIFNHSFSDLLVFPIIFVQNLFLSASLTPGYELSYQTDSHMKCIVCCVYTFVPHCMWYVCITCMNCTIRLLLYILMCIYPFCEFAIPLVPANLVRNFYILIHLVVLIQ